MNDSSVDYLTVEQDIKLDELARLIVRQIRNRVRRSPCVRALERIEKVVHYLVERKLVVQLGARFRRDMSYP